VSAIEKLINKAPFLAAGYDGGDPLFGALVLKKLGK
jgi:hypothetical protein